MESLNDLIVEILQNLIVDGELIKSAYLRYFPSDEEKKKGDIKYVTYRMQHTSDVLIADDKIQNYIAHYDFDIFSSKNYYKIENKLKEILENNDFIWDPESDSPEMYEEDTGLYHKMISFKYMKGINNG